MTDKEQTSRAIFGIGREDGFILNSLTNSQNTAILETLALTDELDAIYNENVRWTQFTGALKKANEKCKKVLPELRSDDLRTALLRTTLKSYEDLGTLLARKEPNRTAEDATATAAIVRMRKLFLKKILSDDLDMYG